MLFKSTDPDDAISECSNDSNIQDVVTGILTGQILIIYCALKILCFVSSKDNCVLNATIPQIPPGKKEIHDNIGK